YPPAGPGYHQGPSPAGYYPPSQPPGYPDGGYPAAAYGSPPPYGQDYRSGVSDGEEFVPHSGSGPAPGPDAPWGGLLATGPFPAATGDPEPGDYNDHRDHYRDVTPGADPRYRGPVPPRDYAPPGYQPPSGYAS